MRLLVVWTEIFLFSAMLSRKCVSSSQSRRIQSILRQRFFPAPSNIHPSDASSRFICSNSKFFSLHSCDQSARCSNITSIGSRYRHFATLISRGGDDGVDKLRALIQKEIAASKEEVVSQKYKRVYIAVGANMGDRFTNLMNALSMLENTTGSQIDLSNDDEKGCIGQDDPFIQVIRTSFLRETEPMYVKDQPSFLNGAVEIQTRLSPHALLLRLKDVESQIGRDFNGGVRYGPRPIDLDILYYDVDDYVDTESCLGGTIVKSSLLDVPHPRIQERDFVLSPMCDLNKRLIHPSIQLTSEEMLENLKIDEIETNQSSDDEIVEPEPPAVKVVPLPRGRMLSFNKTHIMGILNVTPDSFSDGGIYEGSVDKAVQQALELVEDGATIIDIGGESTRPGAKEVEIEIELNRTIPVIRKLREGKRIMLKIDMDIDPMVLGILVWVTNFQIFFYVSSQ
jgi:2-amino-4-hydroxy-6-hydroxymethyldihydropteridine diphosphokinase